MKSRTVFHVVFLIGLIPCVASSQDVRSDVRGAAISRLRQVHTLTHTGSSPFDPPQATDHLFVADTGPGLDTGCSYRSQGPLIISVPVKRVVGDVNADGTLVDPQDLVNRNIVSPYATVTLPAYDVDYFGVPNPPADQPERDRIRINGQDVGPSGSIAYLTGDNNIWKLNEFRIPISQVRFGTRNVGATPTPGVNEIRIDIDVANIPNGTEAWCTAVDWVTVRFDALAPVIMVHGNNSSGPFFDGVVDADTSVAPGVTQAFQTNKIQYDNSITMATNTIAAHAALLQTLIPAKAAEFGADWVHLLAHSKGGLDSREFLASTIPPNFGVLSLTTLSTPHHGSPGADYSLDAVTANSAFSDDTTRTKLAQQVAPDVGTTNLRVSFVEAFNLSNIPLLPTQFTVNGETNPIQYRAVSADANLDNSTSVFGNPTIQYNETGGIPGQGFKPNSVWATVLEQVYRLLGSVESTRLESRTIGISPLTTTVMVVRETPTGQFRTNDFAVTEFSAQINPFVLIGSFKANHSNISRPAAGQLVIDSIKAIQPIR